MEIMDQALKKHKQFKHQWKKDLKALMKQSKILYSIAKKSSSRRELKKTKNLKSKASRKRYDSSSDSSSDYYYSSLSIDRNWDEDRQPAERTEINILYPVVTNNIKTNKYQHSDSIDIDPKFDSKSFDLYIGTRDPLPVVNFRIWGGKEHRAMNVAVLIYLWYSGAINIMIKRRHTQCYARKMRSNKVEYGTSTGVYCTTHDTNVHFYMPKFSSRNIINHRFNVNNKKVNSGIGYDMIIVRYLIVQLVLKGWL